MDEKLIQFTRETLMGIRREDRNIGRRSSQCKYSYGKRQSELNGRIDGSNIQGIGAFEDQNEW